MVDKQTCLLTLQIPVCPFSHTSSSMTDGMSNGSTRHFRGKNIDFFGNAHFSSRKNKGTGTVLLAREQAHSLLFKTPGLFDNGQLLVILERI